jgi:hypothetical protein
MDFVEGLPKSNGKNVIYMVVDNSISMLFIALEHPYYIVIVATTFMDNVYKLHGFSAMIIIDRDPMFLSQF